MGKDIKIVSLLKIPIVGSVQETGEKIYTLNIEDDIFNDVKSFRDIKLIIFILYFNKIQINYIILRTIYLF